MFDQQQRRRPTLELVQSPQSSGTSVSRLSQSSSGERSATAVSADGTVFVSSPTMPGTPELQVRNPHFYYTRGISSYEKKQYERAIADFTKALFFQKDADIYDKRGASHYQQGKYDLAMQDYNDALRLKPNFPEAYNHRGLLYFDQKNYIQAMQDYNQALLLRPNYGAAYSNRGDLYKAQGQVAHAVWDYLTAIHYDTKSINPAPGRFQRMPSIYKNQEVLVKNFLAQLTSLMHPDKRNSISQVQLVRPLGLESDEYLQPFANMLQPALLPHTTTVTDLTLTRCVALNNFEDVFAALKQCVQLRQLDLSNNSLAMQSIDPGLCQQLVHWPALERLSLAGNQLGEVEVKALLKAIVRHSQSLTLLDLQRNHMQLTKGYAQELHQEIMLRVPSTPNQRLTIQVALNFVEAISELCQEETSVPSADLAEGRHYTFQKAIMPMSAEPIKIPSIIHTEALISHDHWLIILFRNTKPKHDPEHAYLLFEGINENNQRFLTMYDFLPASDGRNPIGKVRGPVPFLVEWTLRDQPFYFYSALLVPRIYVTKVIRHIELDRDKSLRYGRSGLTAPKGSFNCLTWALIKLRDAGINALPLPTIPYPSKFLTGRVFQDLSLLDPGSDSEARVASASRSWWPWRK